MAALGTRPALASSARVPASLVSGIALFHPAGLPVTTRVLANHDLALGAPPDTRQPADVIVVDAVRDGAAGQPALSPLVDHLAADLADEGVGYLLARPGDRPRLQALLRGQGLVIADERLHLPIWSASLALVPKDRLPLRYALAKLIPKLSLRPRLAALAGQQWGGAALLASLLPVIGLVVRRPAGRPLFDWLFRLDAEIDPASAIIVRTGWRASEGVTVLYTLPPGAASPGRVIKVGKPGHDLQGEVRRLAELAPAAQLSGATVSRVLSLTHWPDRQVLLQSAVPGQLAATLLSTSPHQLRPVLGRLVGWLERWNAATRTVAPLTAERLQGEWLDPAARLAPELDNASAYLAWLAHQCAAAQDRPLPFVAAHDDLTMWNVVIDGRAGLGIVDWEHSGRFGLPLVDLAYAVVDAVAAADAYRDRFVAFQACYAPGGAHATRVAQWQQRRCRTLALAPDLAQLCWHAAWLHHAANEQAGWQPGSPRPFLQIVQWLAAQSAFQRPAASGEPKSALVVHADDDHP
jgi:aminoglycoside phosphotransferase